MSLLALVLGMAAPLRVAEAQINLPTGYLPVSAYVRASDSPFDGMAGLRLENFEDRQFNLLGVTANTGQVTRVQYPDPNLTSVDSVDSDDGAVNGSGTLGNSYVAGADGGITFSFDRQLIGGYPTHVGVVWTDGSYATTFEAFDGNGASMGVLGPINHADGSWYGTTGEDRFYGVVNPAGISKITIRNPGSPNEIEIDHLQYVGRSNQPPRTPQLVSPITPNLLKSRVVRFIWNDMGDPDNAPRPYREFEMEVWMVSGSSTWKTRLTNATRTMIELPADGNYAWRVRAFDGELWSAWSEIGVFSISEDGLHVETRLRAVQDSATTTAIYVKICGRGQRQRLYVKDLTPGRQPWGENYGLVDGCAPDVAGVVRGVPGDRFTFYSTVSNSLLSDADFFARAKRTSCTIMALGRMSCLEGDTPPGYNPPPVPGAVQLNTVYVDQVYAQRYREGGYWNWCGPSSVAMLLNYYATPAVQAQFDERVTTDALRWQVKENGVGLTHWARVHETIRAAGYEIVTGGRISQEELAASLRAGNPVLLGLKNPGHVVLATGITAEGNFVINDPFGADWMPDFPAGAVTNVTYTAGQNLPEDVPERAGRGDVFTYARLEQLDQWQYVRIERPRPETARSVTPGTPENAPQSNLMPAAPALMDSTVEAMFSATNADLTISYENHIAPSAGLADPGSRLASVRFRATNAAGQQVTAAAPFSLRIKLDPSTVDALGLTEQGSWLAAPPELALMRRNPATGQWERVQNAIVEKAKYRVTAQVDSFTEYVVIPVATNAPLPTVAMAQSFLSVHENAGSANPQIKLSTPMNQVVRVTYETVSNPNGAQAGSDFQHTAGTLVFLPGETVKTVPVPLIDDAIAEQNEVFLVRITSIADITLGNVFQTNITILANDGLSFSSPTYEVYEGDAVQLTVRLSGPSSGPVTVKYATRFGSASGKFDYTHVSGTLTFAPGETVKTIAVQTTRNTVNEPIESFWVDLSAPTGAQLITPYSAQVFIEDGCDPTLC